MCCKQLSSNFSCLLRTLNQARAWRSGKESVHAALKCCVNYFKNDFLLPIRPRSLWETWSEIFLIFIEEENSILAADDPEWILEPKIWIEANCLSYENILRFIKHWDIAKRIWKILKDFPLIDAERNFLVKNSLPLKSLSGGSAFCNLPDGEGKENIFILKNL